MTKERQALIDIFQKWLDTKPREQIIAAQCATIAEEYAEQLLIQRVSQQRELLDWLSNEPDHNIRKSDIDEILQDFKYYQSNCG